MNFVSYKQLDNEQSLFFDEVRRASQKNSWSSARRANINFSLIRAKDFADKEGLIVV